MDTKTCPTCASEINLRASRCPHCRARQPDAPSMYRGGPGRMIAGVCVGVARSLALDPLLVRVAFCIAAFLTGGIVVGVYVVLWAITPASIDGPAPLTRFFGWLSASSPASRSS